MRNNHLSPHDRFFRSAMANSKVAKEFFEQYLPNRIKAVLDLNSIKPKKESFIDDKLKLQISDLLFETKFNKRSGYIYLLVEHQSTSHKLMAFRILKYMLAIMDQHLKVTKSEQLPLVYPMIFYNGSENYNYSTDIFDLFGNDKGLAQDIFWNPYQLIDLSKIPDEELKNYLWSGIIMKTMKHIFDNNFLPFLKN